MRFNTAIAAMMEFVNGAYKWDTRPADALRPFILLLAPYAPHLGERSGGGGRRGVGDPGAALGCVPLAAGLPAAGLLPPTPPPPCPQPLAAEEMWEELGGSGSLAYEPWPEADESLLVQSTYQLPVQARPRGGG